MTYAFIDIAVVILRMGALDKRDDDNQGFLHDGHDVRQTSFFSNVSAVRSVQRSGRRQSGGERL